MQTTSATATSMATRSIFCLVSSRGRADRIIHDFKGAEFSSTDIGTLFLDGRSDLERDSPAPTTAAAHSAGPIRGVLAWIAGVGQLVVPDIGAIIAAGPVIAALHQARNGQLRAITRGLMLLGFAEKAADHYEREIKREGAIMISVHTINPNKILRARVIFAESGGHDIIAFDAPAPLPAITV